MEQIMRVIFWAIGFGGFSYLMCFCLQRNKHSVVNKVPNKERIDVLRKYRSYQKSEKDEFCRTKIVLNNKVPDILKKYQYEEFIAQFEPESDELALGLLDFVCTHFYHNGNAKLPSKRGIADLIESCECTDGTTNCRGLSLILAEMLRMNNIKARHITCMPFEEPFTDCHVVVDCLLPSGKRVMLDPTYRLYIKSKQEDYISIEEFREGLIEGKSFQPSSKASYNGGDFDMDYYVQYMTKNLVRFSTNLLLSDPNADIFSNQIELIPAGYPTKGFSKGRKFIYNPRAFWCFD